MSINQLDLLKSKRFFPLFLTQSLGAFNDNLFKNALVILITYSLASIHFNIPVLITICAGTFILPFFLFSATAGQLADKFDKAALIRYTKGAEVILMLIAAVGLSTQSVTLLLITLFLVGTQAAFFGPIKYAILPDLVKTNELISGNAFIETGTFIAILLGTILGGILASLHVGPALVSIVVVAIAAAGFIASLSIPPTKVGDPDLKINLNPLQESWNIIQYTIDKRDTFLVILGISWFWLIGATYLSQFPTYAKNVLGAQASVVTLFLSVFTIGIAIGSLFCNRILKGRIHATFVPIAALGMSIFAIDLVIASKHGVSEPTLMSLFSFLSHFSNWRILADLFFLAVCGGIYIVPLYAMLQHDSDPAYRSRVIAANNIINAFFMVIAAIATSLMLSIHLSVTHVFLIVAVANLAVSIYICNLLPEELVKSFIIWLFKTLYRAEVRGMENYLKAGKRVLIIANHTSFLDAALLAALLPDRLTFAIDTQVAQKWWMKLILKLVNTYPVDPTNPLATKSLIEYLREDHHVVIFPEGRITVTGSLMRIYEGPGLIADKAEAPLLPIRIDGAQYTRFSYLKNKIKLRWFPKITLTILEPRTFNLSEELNGRERRELISAQLYDIMTDTIFYSSNTNETMFQSLLAAKSIHGKKHLIVEDIERKPLNYKKLILASIVLGRHIAKSTQQGEYVGVLLPNSVANVATFFGLQAHHRVPAMLNFTAGSQNIVFACQTANIRTVYTSRKFVDLAELQHIIDALLQQNIRVVYLEDVKNNLGIINKLIGKFFSIMPSLYYRIANGIKKDNLSKFTNMPAVILFTSGSEGAPKGVALSHINLQANRFQLMARVDFNPRDRVFNALPMFHSFGLNSATLLPIISGIRVFMYPSPLHYRIVPELCYDTGATIFFGTDTFLSNYAKYAHPYNFYSVRYVFAGAERLRSETREVWMHKFGIRIMEGYGATEASPVLSTNTSMQYKMGTVGRLLPGIEYSLQPVEGITNGYRLMVAGPNIMMGYMFSHSPCEIVPPVGGWHDTGDIVHMDEEGYISIKGRAKRFAKIAGEMVSLTAIEEEIQMVWPEHQHAVVSQPDDRKGEQIVLVTNHPEAETSRILHHFKARGVAEIGLPRKIMIVEEVPVLGSGKIDYQSVKRLLEACTTES